MGEFPAIIKYFAIFLALVACHGSIFAHGRKIKPLNQLSSSSTNTQGQKHISRPILAPLKTSINHNVPASPAETKVVSPIIPIHDVARLGDSIPNDVNAFRPTTPGNSPGVGHRKFAGMVAIQSPDVKVSVTEGFKNGFAPTDPGHSPGVGHPSHHKNGQLN